MATPLTAHQLAEALKAEGLYIKQVSGWRDNNRNHKGEWGPIHGVMLHHTGPWSTTQFMVDYCFRGSPSLPGPLGHGVIDRGGTVWLIGNGRANHAGGGDPRVLSAVVEENYGIAPPKPQAHQGSSGAVDGNAHFFGFECINRGDGKETWPDAQFRAMVRASTAICRAYGWTAKSVIGHKEWSDHKPDPTGLVMHDIRSGIAECLRLPAGAWGVKTSTPTPAPKLTLEQRVAKLERRVAELENDR